MANKVVEIILRASDQFSDTTKKAQLQFAAMKISADQFNDSVKKLERLHPGLSADEAQAAARALNQMKDSSESAGRGFANANIAARGLGQELGVTLPRAVTAFLAQSKLIGPALSAAFGAVAVVGIVEVLGQIPAAYDKIVGALTGWNEKSKETYKQVLEDNKKAVEELTRFQAKMAEIAGGSGDQIKLAEAQGRLGANTSAAVTARNAPRGFLSTLAGAVSSYASGVSLPSSTTDEAKRFQENANKAAADVITAQHDITIANAESVKELQKQQEEYSQFFAKQLETFKNSTFSTQVETHEFAQSVIKDWKDMAAEEQKAGDELIQYQDYFAKQLGEFRIKAPGSAADIEAGVKVGDESAKKIIKGYEEAQKQQKEFIKTFQDGIGRAWDDFRQKGFGAFADLANYIAKKFTEGLLTRVLFGAGGGTGLASALGGIAIPGGQGGGLLGGLIGKLGINSGPWSEAIPGKGGGSLLGGLLGGGSSLTALTGSSGLQGIGALLGIQSFSGTGLGLTGGGVTGALGLGGGSGLLGLGAATIPVVGGAIAAGIAIAEAIWSKHRDAPFTRDPNEIQGSREMLFYTGATALADAAKDIANFSHTMNTLPPGVLTRQGLPVALQSSNQFRRDINGLLQQDF